MLVIGRDNQFFPGTGHTIPAGWLVMISPMAVHLNPELFEDPLTFNPWRWQVGDDNVIGTGIIYSVFRLTHG